jgi:pilus assembly protein CpaB
MQRRLITVILFALLAAFVSSTLLYRVISANSGHSAAPAAIKVVVAARDLEAGTVIKDTDIRETVWTSAVSPQWVSRKSEIVGRAVISGINRNEPLPENRLAPKGSSGGLVSQIPAGMRAVSVHIDELSGLSRFIMPGMRVDVLSTGTQKSGDPEAPNMVTRTILQNVEVLSTGQSVERNGKDQPANVQSANLLVTPEQAEVLSSAVAQNRIQLVLRNPLDSSRVTAAVPAVMAPPARVSAAKQPPAKPAFPNVAAALHPPAEKAEAPKPAAITVEVIHGTKKVASPVAAVVNTEAGQ